MDEARESTETATPQGYPKGIARRSAIIDVATDFFGRVGYRGATMLRSQPSAGSPGRDCCITSRRRRACSKRC